jgi:hypothetical protein
MLIQNQRPMTRDEQHRVRAIRKGYWLNRLFGRLAFSAGNPQIANECEICVEHCFIFEDFRDDLPLYVLDFERAILILFGPQIYEPAILIASEGIINNWECDRSFFETFTLRFSEDGGFMLALKVRGQNLARVERVPYSPTFVKLRECQIIQKSTDDLIDNLKKAGVLE